MKIVTQPQTDSMIDDAEPTSPFDSIEARIDSYIANPKLVTPQTLLDLKAEVQATRADVEGEEPAAEPEAPPPGVQSDTLASKIQAVGGKR